MRLTLNLLAALATFAVVPLTTRAADSYANAPIKDPVYIGAEACAECHDNAATGAQYRKWRTTAHARAYENLSMPESQEITRLSGITEAPLKSRMCLGCHATASDEEDWRRDDGFRLEDGMQCEMCHGPGSEYATKEIMKDREQAMKRGLLMLTKDDCLRCHRPKGSHDMVLKGRKPFNLDEAWQAIAHPIPKGKQAVLAAASASPPTSAQPTAAPATPPARPAPPLHVEPTYKNPLNLALSPDNRELWVACEQAGTIAVVDTATRTKALEFQVGGQPTEIAFTPDGRRAFVSNRLDDTVSVVDVATHQVTATIEVGDEPHGVLVDREGKHLYVLNTSIDNVSVIDLASLQEVKRLSASRSPWDLALSPDGQTIVVTNVLSRYTGDRNPSLSELTVIDTARAVVKDRITVPGANLLEGIAWHPSGEYAVFTELRTKNLVPMTRINHGWTITNGLGLLWADGTVDQVLLDQNDICFPDPTDIAITPDGRLAVVTSSSSDRVAVVDLQKLTALLKSAPPEERTRVIPNHTGKPAEFVVAYIPVHTTPRGITCSADGATAFVASKLDDSVTVIDLRQLAVAARVDLGGPSEVTMHRRGERLFHSADIAFRRQFSCSTCHPDGHIDNLAYSIEDSGVGMNPVDNRTLRGIADTAPFKWSGVNPSLKRQCGARLAVFITRIQPFTPAQLEDLHDYLCSIPRPPNRYRALGQDLTEAQRRGQAIFERTRRNDGSLIPPEGRCATCHPAPLYTDGRLHDVGTKFALDRDGKFDPPHLMNIYDSAPYLHNGIARTLEEIWTVYNPDDRHGVTNDMTKDQLNDLVEYLKTL
ncbi:multiheme c-type cytochrome [Opitutus terrae]|uniref:40-residue YVTN family beta-propeller repeat protein n=1 Tax=Opitutus terrae (strain DSM 11246 / JCM 15787 / PB90-1) TaxID=452637 RepID=B1ZY85_OPITP|nr:multiheme c-type cytochrome [Opitutus terrae]ACB76231.1 40-residue YVTN family beta-propeller repeat protein [Opitutus terrae PB90-1]